MLFGSCEVIKGGQEGTNSFGHRSLALDPAVALDSGSVVYEVSLQSLQILKDLKLAIEGTGFLSLAFSFAGALVGFLNAAFLVALPVRFNGRTLPRHLLSRIALAARWVGGCLRLFIAVSH
jgi:hypothetical protein